MYTNLYITNFFQQAYSLSVTKYYDDLFIICIEYNTEV